MDSPPRDALAQKVGMQKDMRQVRAGELCLTAMAKSHCYNFFFFFLIQIQIINWIFFLDFKINK